MTRERERFKDRLEEIDAACSELSAAESQKLRSLIRRIRARQSENKPFDRMLNKLDKEFSRMRQQLSRDGFTKLHISYPSQLPISARAEAIKRELIRSQVLIVCGATASGKTTQLPKIALDAGLGRTGRIGITQPRRIAATSMAQRVAEELNVQLGKEVGYQIRFENRTCERTIIKFMTDGILLAESLGDKNLVQYDTIIVDEAHERSLNIDFILGLLKNLLPKRPELKLVVSSATLDVTAFSDFFSSAPIAKVEGRTFPVEEVFHPPLDPDSDLSMQVRDAIQRIEDLSRPGNILVFLPGEREIKETLNLLEGQKRQNVDILPLYARLTIEEQNRAFRKTDNRRIVLATNVAETSLTLPDIHSVVDSGLVRLSRYIPSYQVQTLQLEQVSQASARQRQGRCGRTREGVCIRLYAEDVLSQSRPYTDPEIRRTSLAGVILHMKSMGLPPIERFPFIDPPKSSSIREGYKSLWQIKALDRENRLTDLGRLLACFPIDPHIARMIHQAKQEGVLAEILVIAAFLSIRDPRERPLQNPAKAEQAHERFKDARSDFVSVLNLWTYIRPARTPTQNETPLRKKCKTAFLNYRRIREWMNLRDDLAEIVQGLKWKIAPVETNLDARRYDKIHRCLLAGRPTHVGVRSERNAYVGIKEQRFYIFPGSGVFHASPKWVMAAALVETTKRYARLVAEIDPRQIEQVADHLCTFYYKDIHFNSKTGFVVASKTVTFFDLTIQSDVRVHYGSVDPRDARRVFIEEGLVAGKLNSRRRWYIDYKHVLGRIAEIENRMRRPACLLDQQALFAHFDHLLPPTVCSAQSLDKWIDESKAEIGVRAEQVVRSVSMNDCLRDYPDYLTFLGQRFELVYRYAPGHPNDGIHLICPVSLIWILPEWAPDWLVPGWLLEKVKALIRSLPKSLRVQASPIETTATAFVQAVREGRLDDHRPLARALAEYLNTQVNINITANDFATDRLADHLVMKVVLKSQSGKTLEVASFVPDRRRYCSRLPDAFSGIDQWASQQSENWPVDELPDHWVLSKEHDLIGYPALIDQEQQVGCGVFMNEYEARIAHRSGVLRLFRIHYSDWIEKAEQSLRTDRGLWQFIKEKKQIEAGLTRIINQSIWDALTDDDRHAIRSQAIYQQRSEAIGDALVVTIRARVQQFVRLFEQKKQIIEALDKVWGGKESVADIRSQIEELLGTGFIRNAHLWKEYPRYLSAISVRLQRLNHSSEKDLRKLQMLRPFQKQLDDRLSRTTHPERDEKLLIFSTLMQEYRISLFAPEIRTRQKVSPKLLESFVSDW